MGDSSSLLSDPFGRHPATLPGETGTTDSLISSPAIGPRLEDAARRAPATPPATAARILQAQRRTGLPLPVIERNLEQVERESAALDFNAERYRRESPLLARWLAEHPAHLALAQDDLRPLSAMERTLSVGSNLARAAAAGVMTASRGFWGTVQAASEGLGLEDLATFARGTAVVAEQMQTDIRGPQRDAGFVERGVYSGVESLGLTAAGAAITAATGGGSVTLLGTLGVATGGQAYSEARQQGVQPGLAAAYATGQGAIEVATERLPVKWILKDLAAHTGLLRTLLHQAATEIPGEQLATALQDFNAWAVLPANQDRTLADYLAERPSAAAQTLIASVVGVVGQSAVARAIDATVPADVLAAIGEAAKASRALKADPESVAGFVDQATAGALDTVHLPVDTFTEYFQSQRIDPATMAERLTGDADAYTRARQTGEDLAVPMGRYVTEIAATSHNEALRREARFRPDALNQRESEALEQAVATEAAQATAMPESTAAPIASTVAAQLEAIGVEPSTAAANAAIWQHAFASIAERAGLDPVQLFQRYGLQVRRAGMVPPRGNEGAIEAVAPDAPIGPVPDSLPTTGETPAQRERRRQTHEAQLLAAVLRDARAVDPGVNLDDVRAEFAFRRGLLDEKASARLESGRDPIDLLRAVAAAGGLGPETAGGLTGERRWLAEGQTFGRVHGVPGVFRAEQARDDRGQVVSGLGFDVMVQRLQQEPRFAWIETTDQLIDAIDTVIRQGPAEDAFPGSDTIATSLGIRAGEAWWRDGWRGPRELAQDERGRIAFGSTRQFSIELLKGADLSTFLHESAHFFLEVQGDVVDTLRAQASLTPAQQQLVADYDTVLAFVGATTRAGIGEAQHETFARAFEAYLLEGRAPSVGLRSVFARVRAWLVGIYGRSSRTLRVTLTKEVRDVMDRLLATDAAIESAAREASVAPLFTDAIAAAVGLTGEELRAYKETVDRAGEAARDRLSRTLLAEWERERAAWWREERLVERAAVVVELQQEPVYRALALLQRGRTPDGAALPAGVEAFKLSQEALVAQFGEAVLKQLPRPLVYAKGGVAPSVAAELLGFESGPALVNALVSVEPFDRAVDAATDARMKARHGDTLLDGTLSEEARRAVLEGGAEVFAAELQALEAASRRTGQPRIRATPIAVLRDLAEQRIASTPIRQVRPSTFAAAAARAGRRALEAAGRQDFGTALEAQQQRILNAELYRAALAARELVDQARSGFRPIFGRDAALAQRANMDLVAAARALLVQFGLGTPSAGTESVFQYLQQVQKYDPETYADLEAAIDAASQPGRPYQELTVDEFVAVRDAVLNLWHLAKRSKEILVDGQRRQIDDVRAELEAHLVSLKAPAKRGYERAMTRWEKTRLSLLGFKAALRRVESWVDAIDRGDALGPFRRILWTPISEAGSAYRLGKRAALERYQAIVRAVEPTLQPGEIVAGEIGYTFRDKAELLHALLHTGNASNLSKLLRGRGWGQDRPDGTLDQSRWDALVARFWRDGTLTRADYDYVQGVWDLLETLKPEAQRVHHDLYGLYFSEVTAREVRTPFGTFRGGYMPAIVDVDLAPDAALRADRAALEETPTSFLFPTTGRGFTKARVEAYARPLALDLRVVPAHLDKVLRFIHLEPRVKDAARLVTSKGFRRALDAFDPAVAGELLVPWLQRSARQTVSTPSQGHGGRGADRMLRTLRARVGLQLMAGNVVNTLQQITGLSSALVKVKPGYLAGALGRYLRNPRAVARDVAERSPFMSTRTGTQTIEIAGAIDDLLLNPSTFERAQAFAIRHGYILQAATQNIVDTITWAGAYEQATAAGGTELEAVRQADAAVRATQSSFNAEDLSRFETGSAWLRLFSMFYSFWNQQANTLGTEFVVAARTMGLRPGAGKLFYVYTFGFMLPAVLSDALVRAASGEPWDEDGDGLFDDLVFSWFLGSQGRAASAMVPIVGPVVQAGFNQWNDRWYDDRISLSPAVQALEAAVRSPDAAYRAIAEGEVNRRSVRDALTMIGLLSGLPAGAAARPLGYAADVASGETEPTGPLDAARGAVVGR